MTTAIALFTRDLRVRDNPVLAAAHRGADRIVPLFVLDDTMLHTTAHGRPNRFGFLCDALRDLDASLRARGGALVVRRGDWVREVARVAGESGAGTVHVARDVSMYAQTRLARLAAAGGFTVQPHESVTVLPGETFGKPYVIFTPYYKRWIDTPWRSLAPMPKQLTVADGLASEPIPDARPPDSWEGGETAGLARLKAWTPKGLPAYDELRDSPGGDHTSRLSPYLHFGCVSPVEVAGRLRDRDGGAPWVRQVCWRDFYSQLLHWRPETSTEDVRVKGAPVWRNAPGDLEAWKSGRTGFPFVDAAMRQLRGEGWMHNRVRMVTASFLTKDLQIDWREGAAHFMDLLVDGDVANNQLGWQWVAGTGTDTNPHRVLNPTVQGRRHDPDGVYLRRWLPELRDLPGDADLHDPPPEVRRACDYPDPLVDHHEAIEQWRESRAQRAAG